MKFSFFLQCLFLFMCEIGFKTRKRGICSNGPNLHRRRVKILSRRRPPKAHIKDPRSFAWLQIFQQLYPKIFPNSRDFCGVYDIWTCSTDYAYILHRSPESGQIIFNTFLGHEDAKMAFLMVKNLPLRSRSPPPPQPLPTPPQPPHPSAHAAYRFHRPRYPSSLAASRVRGCSFAGL